MTKLDDKPAVGSIATDRDDAFALEFDDTLRAPSQPSP